MLWGSCKPEVLVDRIKSFLRERFVEKALGIFDGDKFSWDPFKRVGVELYFGLEGRVGVDCF